jgi:antirestriction protein ArdC
MGERPWRRAWAAPAAGMRISSPCRRPSDQGFAVNGLSSQIVTVPSFEPLASQWSSGMRAMGAVQAAPSQAMESIPW